MTIRFFVLTQTNTASCGIAFACPQVLSFRSADFVARCTAIILLGDKMKHDRIRKHRIFSTSRYVAVLVKYVCLLFSR